jgi:hypothetical protein
MENSMITAMIIHVTTTVLDTGIPENNGIVNNTGWLVPTYITPFSNTPAVYIITLKNLKCK